MLERNPPIDTLMKAKQHGGKSMYIYEFEKNMKVDLDQKYGEEYGNELTLREAYDLTMKILKEHEGHISQRECPHFISSSLGNST